MSETKTKVKALLEQQKKLNSASETLAKLETLYANREALDEEIANYESELETQLNAETSSVAPTPKRRGPKPGSKRVTATAKPAKKATATKVTAKPAKKTASTKGRSNTRQTEGRRAIASGSRPPIKEAICTIMGTKVMSAQEVHDAIIAKGWTPNAKNPRQYIGYVLSSESDLFERVKSKGRGFYRVAGTPPAKKDAKVAEKKAAPTNNVEKNNAETDEILAEAGVVTTSN